MAQQQFMHRASNLDDIAKPEFKVRRFFCRFFDVFFRRFNLLVRSRRLESQTGLSTSALHLTSFWKDFIPNDVSRI